MPRVGEPCSWVPASCEGASGIVQHRGGRANVTVHGKITYVNEAHGFYLAEAEIYGYTLRECFKFAGGAAR